MNFFIIIAFLFTVARGNAEYMLKNALTKVIPQTTNTLCARFPDWTLLSHQKDCHKFYACLNHKPKEFHCAKNYYFNKIALSCLPGICETDSTATETRSCQAHLEVVERVQGDCNAFTWCFNGMQEQLRCPAGHYFNAAFASCQPADLDVYHQCSCLLPEHTVMVNEHNCQTYYMCAGGKALLERCPRGHYYNESIRSCLPDVAHVCMSAPSELEVAMLDVCDRIGAKGAIFQPHPDNCSKFFLCQDGRIFMKECPKGFYFDNDWRICRVDQQGSCAKQVPFKGKKTPTKVEQQPGKIDSEEIDETSEEDEEEGNQITSADEEEVMSAEPNEEESKSEEEGITLEEAEKESEEVILFGEVQWDEQFMTAKRSQEGASEEKVMAKEHNVAEMERNEEDEGESEEANAKELEETKATQKVAKAKEEEKVAEDGAAVKPEIKQEEPVTDKSVSETVEEALDSELLQLQSEVEKEIIEEHEERIKEQQKLQIKSEDEKIEKKPDAPKLAHEKGEVKQNDKDAMKIDTNSNIPPIMQSLTPQKKPILFAYEKLASKFMYS